MMKTRSGKALWFLAAMLALAGPVSAEFAYVANEGSNDVSGYTIDAATGALTPIAGSPFPAGAQPVFVTVDPSGKFAYVANLISNNISGYTINAATGALTPIAGSPFPAGTGPFPVTVDPSGRFAYVANANPISNNISGYTINAATGALTSIAGSPFPTGTGPDSVTVDPSAKFVYVANAGSNNISGYAINAATGALTPIAGSPFPATGTNPDSVTVDPSGKFAYVANAGSNNISGYAINAATGALTAVAGSPFPAGTDPRFITVDPSGKFGYVANTYSNNVSGYTINAATGALTPIAGSPFPAGTNPESVTVDPSGKFAYVANPISNNVSGYTINAATGALTPLAGSPFTAGLNPASIITTAGPVVNITEAFGAATVPLNGSTSLSFTITNPNATNALTATGFTDSMPAGLVITTPNGLTTTCGAGTIIAIAGTGTVSLAGASLAGGASCMFSVNVTGTTAGVKNNSVTISDTVAGAGNTATATLAVVGPPVLTKTFGVATIFLGGSTSLTFAVTNPNTTALSATAFTDSMPAGLVVTTPNGLTGSCGGGAITATPGSGTVSLAGASLAKGASCMFSVNVTGTGAGVKNNSVTVLDTVAGAGNTAIATLAVVGPPILTEAFGVATIPLGGSTSLTLTVSNPNATGLTATGFIDLLPAGLVVTTPNGVTANCAGGTITATPGSGTVSLAGAGLPGGASCTVSATVTGTSAGVKNNSVTVSDTFAGTGNTATATVTVAAPSALVVPSSGTGSSQAFTFTYTDLAGYQDISGSQIIISSTSSGAGACYILFGRGSNAIALADDAGTPGPLTTIGAPTVLQNSQCSVLASISSQSFAGNSVMLTVYVVFKPSFAGPKNVYTAYSTNGGVSSGLQQVGTFTATVNTTPISAVSVTPAAGSGQAQAFTFDYFDPNGYPNTSGSQVLFNGTTSSIGACYILYGRGTNQIALSDDTGSNFTTAPLGGQTVLQNSQCTVFVANSYQSGLGTHLLLTLFVAFKPGFAGIKNVYSGSTDNGGNRSAFVQLGTWTVPVTAPPLGVNSVTPSAASGPSNALTFVFSDPSGFADISGGQVIVNPTLSAGAGSCYLLFANSGLITLIGDDGVNTTMANLGQPAVLQNSQCVVNAAASYQAGTDKYLSLTLFVTMKTTGANNVYASVRSILGATSPFSQLGTWNVTSPSILTPVSVSPGTGAGLAGTPQVFTLTYSDPLGANDISGSQIIINPALQGAFACYVLYGRGTNVVAIANDIATVFTNGTLGTAGTLQNSQCSIDLSKSFQVQTGNTVNLTLAVTFKPNYKGLMYAFSNVVDNAGNASSFPALGAFLVQ